MFTAARDAYGETAGFCGLGRNLTGGIVALHRATKPLR
jgi:hypothetical protein